MPNATVPSNAMPFNADGDTCDDDTCEVDPIATDAKATDDQATDNIKLGDQRSRPVAAAASSSQPNPRASIRNPWTEDEKEILRAMRAEGHTWSQIAEVSYLSRAAWGESRGADSVRVHAGTASSYDPLNRVEMAFSAQDLSLHRD